MRPRSYNCNGQRLWILVNRLEPRSGRGQASRMTEGEMFVEQDSFGMAQRPCPTAREALFPDPDQHATILAHGKRVLIDRDHEQQIQAVQAHRPPQM